jgi:hypothetical protein
MLQRLIERFEAFHAEFDNNVASNARRAGSYRPPAHSEYWIYYR